MFIAIIISITIILWWGASIASESSLPWEFLYLVKTNINEPIKEALTFWAKSDAELDIELIQERIDEKNKLEISGNLTAKNSLNIDNLILGHYKEYKSEKKKLISSKDTITASNLDIKISNLLKSSWITIDLENDSKNTAWTLDEKLQENIDNKIESISNAGSDLWNVIDTTIEVSSDTINELWENIELWIDNSIEVTSDLKEDIQDITDELFQDKEEWIKVESKITIENK